LSLLTNFFFFFFFFFFLYFFFLFFFFIFNMFFYNFSFILFFFFFFFLTWSLMIFLIIVINMESLLVINVVVEVFLQMILWLCAPTRSQLKKLLKLANKWAKNNEMQFGINNGASLIVRGEVSRFLYNSNPTFYLSSQESPKTKLLYLLRCTVFKGFRIVTDHTENE